MSIITEILYPNKGINIQASGFIPTNAKIQHAHLRSWVPFCNVQCKADFENMAKYSGMMIKRQDYINL